MSKRICLRKSLSGPVAAASEPIKKRNSGRRLFGGIEVVVCRVGNSQLLIEMSGITAPAGRLPAFGVDALHGLGSRENAITLVAGNVQQKPGDGVRVARLRFRCDRAGDAAPVVRLPGRAGEVLAKAFPSRSRSSASGALSVQENCADSLLQT